MKELLKSKVSQLFCCTEKQLMIMIIFKLLHLILMGF